MTIIATIVNYVNFVNLHVYDILQSHRSVLHTAASIRNNTKVVEILTEADVDVNTVDKVSDYKVA